MGAYYGFSRNTYAPAAMACRCVTGELKAPMTITGVSGVLVLHGAPGQSPLHLGETDPSTRPGQGAVPGRPWLRPQWGQLGRQLAAVQRSAVTGSAYPGGVRQ